MQSTKYKLNLNLSIQLKKIVISNHRRILFIPLTEVLVVKLSLNKEHIQLIGKEENRLAILQYKEELYLLRMLLNQQFLQVKTLTFANIALCESFVYEENNKCITFKNSSVCIQNPSLKLITTNQGINIFCGLRKPKQRSVQTDIKKPDTKYFYSIPG